MHAAGSIVMLGFIKLLCHFTLAENFEVQHVETKEQVSSLLRCLVLYSQWMLLVVSLNVDWPSPVMYTLQALGWFWASTNLEILRIDCLLSETSGVHVAVQRVMLYVSVPVVRLVVLLLLEFLLSMIKQWSIAAGMADRLSSSAMVVVYFFLPVC
jgi:hypothetical protein